MSSTVPSNNRRTTGPERRRRAVALPGGLAHSRRMVRSRGGAVAVGMAIGILVAGRIAGWILGGTIGSAVSFVAMVLALPVMPVLGMPAAGGSSRLVLAVVLSAVLWWVLGQLAAGRAGRKPVVGWREWTREFLVFGAGMWAGTIGGLVLAGLVLGAL